MTATNVITGHRAIQYVTARGNGQLHKYADATEAAREVSLDEAREIAGEDPSLIYVELPAADDCGIEIRSVVGFAPTDLHALMIALQYPRASALDWHKLPTFGGEMPASTMWVWSWDETHELFGERASDLRVQKRVAH